MPPTGSGRGELDGREAPFIEGVVEPVRDLFPCGWAGALCGGFAGEVKGLGGAADGESFEVAGGGEFVHQVVVAVDGAASDEDDADVGG
jgi:hypothetical protein